MTEVSIVRSVAICIVALMLVACGSSPTAPASAPPMSPSDAYQASRYSIQQDRGPSRPIDPAQIREVIPIIENRTAAGNRSPYTVNGRTYRIMPSEEGYRERGFASWYGEKFHGHRTSNGEIYDMYQLSAAHKSMPIPGYLRVTNLENNRSIIVRVNDRGPFHSDRIIDLSYAAAYMLGFDARGTAMVEVESVIPTLAASQLPENVQSSATAEVAEQYLQVGAFSDLHAAEQLSVKLRNLTTRPVFIRSVQAREGNQTIHRVRVGPIPAAEVSRITASVVDADLGSPYTVRD
jgi:rare lipoprotein A